MRLETSFFFNFATKKKESKNGQYFPTKKKTKKVGKNKIAAARLASILATRWTGNRLFFMDSPRRLLDHLSMLSFSPLWILLDFGKHNKVSVQILLGIKMDVKLAQPSSLKIKRGALAQW